MKLTHEELLKYSFLMIECLNDWDEYSDEEQGVKGYYYTIRTYYPNKNADNVIENWRWVNSLDVKDNIHGVVDDAFDMRFSDMLEEINRCLSDERNYKLIAIEKM